MLPEAPIPIRDHASSKFFKKKFPIILYKGDLQTEHAMKHYIHLFFEVMEFSSTLSEFTKANQMEVKGRQIVKMSHA
jgi:hypothetical protein